MPFLMQSISSLFTASSEPNCRGSYCECDLGYPLLRRADPSSKSRVVAFLCFSRNSHDFGHSVASHIYRRPRNIVSSTSNPSLSKKLTIHPNQSPPPFSSLGNDAKLVNLWFQAWAPLEIHNLLICQTPHFARSISARRNPIPAKDIGGGKCEKSLRRRKKLPLRAVRLIVSMFLADT